jgi:hypothetical protein
MSPKHHRGTHDGDRLPKFRTVEGVSLRTAVHEFGYEGVIKIVARELGNHVDELPRLTTAGIAAHAEQVREDVAECLIRCRSFIDGPDWARERAMREVVSYLEGILALGSQV